MLLALTFLIFLTLPAAMWLFLVRKKNVHLAIAFGLSLILGSVIFIGAFLVDEKREKEALYEFDLNGDRMFSDEEMTPEAQAAMDRWTLDAGRMFIPFVAVIVTGAWATLNFTTFYILTPIPKADPDGVVNA